MEAKQKELIISLSINPQSLRSLTIKYFKLEKLHRKLIVLERSRSTSWVENFYIVKFLL